MKATDLKSWVHRERQIAAEYFLLRQLFAIYFGDGYHILQKMR